MADAATATKPETPAAPAVKPKFTARLRYARISARKMRYVVDLIRGKDYNSAIAILRSCSKRGAMFCKKLLESAFGNATDIINTKDLEVDVNKLHVVEARVDPGPIIKRWRASSQRRPTMIKKRLCHVIFTLEERDLKESRPERAKRQKQDRQRQAAAQKAAAKKDQPAAPAPSAKPAEAKAAEAKPKDAKPKEEKK
ncbi:MAG: 50S ribosomal protein L22 [Planctomycetes bacterium]|nr:50S ribosomal protein L22 [Planctomycetota bacterium]